MDKSPAELGGMTKALTEQGRKCTADFHRVSRAAGPGCSFPPCLGMRAKFQPVSGGQWKERQMPRWTGAKCGRGRDRRRRLRLRERAPTVAIGRSIPGDLSDSVKLN